MMTERDRWGAWCRVKSAMRERDATATQHAAAPRALALRVVDAAALNCVQPPRWVIVVALHDEHARARSTCTALGERLRAACAAARSVPQLRRRRFDTTR
jgi:hypothetical protein